MEKFYKESENSFSFEFNGESYIYADTLSATIDNTIKALQYITSKKDPEAFVKLKITKFSHGSFDIDLQAIVSFIPTIINPPNIQLAGSIVGLLVNSFELKKHLKGKKPSKVVYREENAVVTNEYDEELAVDKETAKTYFENGQIDAHIVNIFNVVMPDDGKSGLTIKQDHGKSIKIEKEDFGNMATRVVEDNHISETLTNIVTVDLPLRKPDLLGNSQWGFWYVKYINATIKDKEWLEKVHAGQIRELYAGVRIPVKLQIECDLDEHGSPIPDSDRYIILEVTGNVIEPDNDNQIKMI